MFFLGLFLSLVAEALVEEQAVCVQVQPTERGEKNLILRRANHFQVKFEVKVTEPHYITRIIHVTLIHFVEDGTEWSNFYSMFKVQAKSKAFKIRSDLCNVLVILECKFLHIGPALGGEYRYKTILLEAFYCLSDRGGSATVVFNRERVFA